MKREPHEPKTEITSAPASSSVETQSIEDQRAAGQHVAAAVSTRHDGWSGEKMAKFCEALAETAVVAEACDQAGMGISGAYALRRRNPFFAAAWDAALTIARERLADTLLARSIEGNIEQIWRDGELVGERHVIDNRLGLAILRRLDRLAETGTTVSMRGERNLFSGEGRSPVRAKTPLPAVLPHPQPFDWELMVNALRTGDPDDIASALALLGGEGDKVEEVEDPPVSLNQNKEPEGIDLSDRCWRDEIEQIWMTDFAPPEGFDLYQKGKWGSYGYERECTPEEAQVLEADEASADAQERAQDESLRNAWFELLRLEKQADGTAADEA
jgi:catechol 2,3-dioxygenase-like lactoylglutathione lyase family enzyme